MPTQRKHMNATQSVGEIQETRNYELFKFVKGNRAINRSHVNRLKEKISRRDLKEIPILVGSLDKSGKYPIFDGQHRFAVKSVRCLQKHPAAHRPVPTKNELVASHGDPVRADFYDSC